MPRKSANHGLESYIVNENEWCFQDDAVGSSEDAEMASDKDPESEKRQNDAERNPDEGAKTSEGVEAMEASEEEEASEGQPGQDARKRKASQELIDSTEGSGTGGTTTPVNIY